MELNKALIELAKEVKEEVLKRLRSQVGVNPRVGRNTLVGSELEKSIEVVQTSEETIVFKIADYYEYIVRGWQRTGNYPNTVNDFLENILSWVRRHNVTLGDLTENQIVWVLYKKMLIEGRPIAPRPFIEYGESADEVLPFLDTFFDAWANEVFKAIINEIKYFK